MCVKISYVYLQLYTFRIKTKIHTCFIYTYLHKIKTTTSFFNNDKLNK